MGPLRIVTVDLATGKKVVMPVSGPAGSPSKIPIDTSAMPKPAPVPKKPRTYYHNGTKLVPMTLAEASSLDKGDVIKYIGPEMDRSYPARNPFAVWQRRPFTLTERPKVHGSMVALGYYSSRFKCPLSHLALVQRGNPYEKDFKHAERLIPINLKGFKKNLSNMIKRTQENIDEYLKDLPLHKKLELFKNLSPEDTLIYECLYKDIEVLIGLKEDEAVPLPPEST